MEQESLPREGISELDTGSEWEYALWQSANRENSLFGFRISDFPHRFVWKALECSTWLHTAESSNAHVEIHRRAVHTTEFDH